MDISLKVREIVAEQLDVDPSTITDESRFIDDLGADSLAVVELALAFETAFDIPIPDDVISKMETVGDVIAYVQRPAAE
jgi:acyl carrier protein